MRQNQKGFSLVELIVVIAIMGILTAGGVMSFGLVTGQNVKSCASQLDSYISQTKTETLSRESANLTVFVKDDGVYVNMAVNGSGQDVKIGKSGLTVKYKTTGGTEVTLSETERLTIEFDRSSGAFKALGGSNYCKEILLNGGNHSKKIILIPQTGKHFIEDVG